MILRKSSLSTAVLILNSGLNLFMDSSIAAFVGSNAVYFWVISLISQFTQPLSLFSPVRRLIQAHFQIVNCTLL